MNTMRNKLKSNLLNGIVGTTILVIASLTAAHAGSQKYIIPDTNAKAVAVATYWYDGDKKLPLVMDENIIASFNKDRIVGKDVTGNTKGSITFMDVSQLGGSKAVLSAGDGSLSPVFYNNSAKAGQRRALPGGVIVGFDKNWSKPQIEQWFADRNLSVQENMNIPNMYVVASPAGQASLDLANTLFESGDVVISSPNWWLEMHTR